MFYLFIYLFIIFYIHLFHSFTVSIFDTVKGETFECIFSLIRIFIVVYLFI